ncbi:nucleotidyltransferase family protein [Neobacillus sp. D3-1R]|uniref:nucleotidyltransferase family protein n=1 Tax=Neobacillus sp. D3-1R TaxID=3445778 RepID=UPI003FA09811
MKGWEKVKVSPHASIRETLKVIDDSSIQIALVVNHKNQLLGTVTDGDIRRGMLKGIPLDDLVTQVMNSNPTTAAYFDNKESLLLKLKSKKLHHLPIVNDQNQLVGLQMLDDLITTSQKDNIVVLMAGGLGSRLMPLTKNCPKPLLKVGKKPILETIIGNFIESGFSKFYISVNYKSEMIKDYFGDGSNLGIDIQYINEEKRMGTAGALSLLLNRPDKPFFVMNGDLLTKVNFRLLLDFHNENKSHATMCVREHDIQIPYGVVKLDNQRLLAIDEKPIHRSFVSAGIYVLDPVALDYIPKDSFYDMPTLFERLIENNKNSSVFPIREYWCDIGRIDDYNKANQEYEEVFR